jgi:hypothetical protein
MENKQTAVAWLEDQIFARTKFIDINLFQVIEQAKEIEKERIEDAYDAGLFDGSMDDVNDRMHKQYYNETYGGDK